MKANKKGRKKLLLLIGLILLVLAMLVMLLSYLISNGILFDDGKFGVVDESTLQTGTLDTLPQNVLFITGSRRAYKEGEMQLVIPSLDLDVPIGEDTTPADLEVRPGLYEFSQMPGEGDVNVSIAGHRDIGHKEFYYLDQMGEGKKMFLVYKNYVFEYDFYSSKIVQDDDWSVITRQGFSVLTLTTCDPIGTRLKRLIVQGRLVDIYPYNESMVFAD